MTGYYDVRDEVEKLLDDARAEAERSVARCDALVVMRDLANLVDSHGAPIADLADIERELSEVDLARWRRAMRTVDETEDDKDQPSTDTGDMTR